MNRDVSATTTYVMWSEERLWNVGVLQTVRLSSLLLSVFISTFHKDEIDVALNYSFLIFVENSVNLLLTI
jgi:hypothetical protein